MKKSTSISRRLTTVMIFHAIMIGVALATFNFLMAFIFMYTYYLLLTVHEKVCVSVVGTNTKQEDFIDA